jgi:hypothetical protein
MAVTQAPPFPVEETRGGRPASIWIAALAVVVAGCDLVFPLEGPPDAAAGRECFGSDFLQVCLDEPLPTSATFRDVELATGAMESCLAVADGPATICVIGASTWTLENRATATGPRALVIVGDTITIDGTLDLSGSVSGAGAALAECRNAIGVRGERGGGAGGSHGSRGGDGGGLGGRPPEARDGPGLRGGCEGGTGSGGATGGRGGGVVGILARQAIFVVGAIDVSGAGGAGGSPDHGGGGGGAGGMIVLDAPTIAVAGVLMANGGGGGEGGGPLGTIAGAPGESPSDPGRAAAGGASPTPAGGPGGVGAIARRSGENGSPSVSVGGGAGGGGGGVGVVFTFGDQIDDAPDRISPPPL